MSLPPNPIPGIDTYGRLTPEQSARFIEIVVSDSRVLKDVRIVDLRPWHKRPLVWIVFFVSVAIGATIALFWTWYYGLI